MFFCLRRMLADWRRNLAGGERCCRHLVKQRLKQVVVCAVDQDDLRGGFLQCLGGGQSAKTSADDDDSWLSHLFLDCLSPPRSMHVRSEGYGAACTQARRSRHW